MSREQVTQVPQGFGSARCEAYIGFSESQGIRVGVASLGFLICRSTDSAPSLRTQTLVKQFYITVGKIQTSKSYGGGPSRQKWLKAPPGSLSHQTPRRIHSNGGERGQSLG